MGAGFIILEVDSESRDGIIRVGGVDSVSKSYYDCNFDLTSYSTLYSTSNSYLGLLTC